MMKKKSLPLRENNEDPQVSFAEKIEEDICFLKERFPDLDDVFFEELKELYLKKEDDGDGFNQAELWANVIEQWNEKPEIEAFWETAIQVDREIFEEEIQSTTEYLRLLGQKLSEKLSDKKGIITKPQESIKIVNTLHDFFRSFTEDCTKKIDQEEKLKCSHSLWSYHKQFQHDFLFFYMHDINNYLSLLGYAHVLPYKTAAESEQIRKELLSLMQGWTRFLDGLILLAQEPESSLYTISELGEHAVNYLQEIADKKNIQLSFSQSDLQIFTDASYIEVILRNIIENALKFSPGDGTGKVSLLASQEKDDVVLHVIDNGVGLSEEEKEALEELFQGFDHSVVSTHGTNGEHGTGQGLRGCAKYSKRLGIRVEIESSMEEGKSGTTFILTIPATKERYNELAESISATQRMEEEIASRKDRQNYFLVEEETERVQEAIQKSIEDIAPQEE